MLFGQFKDFLDQTLHADSVSTFTRVLNDAELVLHDKGILEVLPKPDEPINGNEKSKHYQKAILLSAGIHGDETAPIEALNEVVNAIIEGNLVPTQPTLIILGNPDAMIAQKRFIDQNLNRLFSTQTDQTADSQEHDIEEARARCIQKVIEMFHHQHPIHLHLDLHATIRSSEYENFGLYPLPLNSSALDSTNSRNGPQKEHINLLVRLGVQALVETPLASSTFSAYTSRALGAESYTLELGQARLFGQNDQNVVQDLANQLSALISKGPLETSTEPSKLLKRFEVVHEIIHTGAGFNLKITDSIPNFYSFPPDRLVWSSEQSSYRTGRHEERILFPNKNVPEGQRAGLMIRER